MNRPSHILSRAARLSRTFGQSRRRFASDHSHAHAEVSESMGTGFWIAVASIPTTMLVYTVSRPTSEDDTPALTRLIQWYEDDLRGKWIRGNDLRSRYIDQARLEGNVLMNSKRSDWVDLKFPEAFNVGSPFNVSPGHYAKMDSVIDHYNKVNSEAQAKIAGRS